LRACQGENARDRIPSLWATPDDDVKAATVRLSRHTDRDLAGNVVRAALSMDHPEIRIEAIELGLMHAMKEAWMAAVELVSKPQAGFARAAIAVAALGDQRDQDRLALAYEQAGWERDALFASGFAGTVGAADACLAAMKKGILPRVAAESFCTITGLDLAQSKMVAPEPPLSDDPVPFEEDDLDADLVPKADEDLPLPEFAEVERWWSANRARFAPNQRYLGGRPWSMKVLHERLAAGPMRRRHGWAFEVAMHTQGAHQIQTRAFMSTQQSQIGTLGKALSQLDHRNDPWARR